MSHGPPNLGAEIQPEKTEVVEPGRRGRRKQYRIAGQMVYSRYIIHWGIVRRRLRSSLLELMMLEMRVKLSIANTNDLFREQLLIMMDHQISYLTEVRDLIIAKKDPLNMKQKRKKKKIKISQSVFETLVTRIEIEKEDLLAADINVMKKIEDDLKKHLDTRLEPRSCFWILFQAGMMLHSIDKRVDDEFEVLMRISLEYDNPYKHTLMIFLNFVHALVAEVPPFYREDARTVLRPNSKNSGYSMAHWIKFRYGSGSQYYMEYDRLINYFVRSFGMIRGRAPDFKRQGYFMWLERTFRRMEGIFLKAELYRDLAKGDSMEGVIAGVIDQMTLELSKREYDEDGKLLNQPLGGEGALRFLNWLLEVGVNRFRTPNFVIQPDIRMDIGMFDFIQPTIKWQNELGERLLVDWLGLDEVQEDA